MTVDLPFPRGSCTYFGTLLLRAPIPVRTAPTLYPEEWKTLGEHLKKPRINQAVLGVLGRAQRIYGMVVHLAVVLSNHYHFLLAPTDAKQLADFMGFVNSNIAREVGRLVNWKERFWGRRYQGIVVSDEVVAQLGRLEYFLANCVKENLVESPHDWPGVHCARSLVEGRKLEGTWFNRTAFLPRPKAPEGRRSAASGERL